MSKLFQDPYDFTEPHMDYFKRKAPKKKNLMQEAQEDRNLGDVSPNKYSIVKLHFTNTFFSPKHMQTTWLIRENTVLWTTVCFDLSSTENIKTKVKYQNQSYISKPKLHRTFPAEKQKWLQVGGLSNQGFELLTINFILSEIQGKSYLIERGWLLL